MKSRSHSNRVRGPRLINEAEGPAVGAEAAVGSLLQRHGAFIKSTPTALEIIRQLSHRLRKKLRHSPNLVNLQGSLSSKPYVSMSPPAEGNTSLYGVRIGKVVLEEPGTLPRIKLHLSPDVLPDTHCVTERPGRGAKGRTAFSTLQNQRPCCQREWE